MQPSFTHLPQYFFRSLCFWPFFFIPIFVKPFSNSSFLLHKMSSTSNGPYFLTFTEEISSITWMGWWGGAPSRPQDPCSTFPHGLQGEFFFVSLFGKMLFPCFIESVMLRCCHFIVCSCWNLGHCMIDYVVILALEHFWIVVFFGHGVTWTMLVAHEFWQCW